MHVALTVPNWVGDAVMATPALRALREQLPAGTRLTGVVRPVIADVLAGTHWLDEYILYDRKSPDRSQHGRNVIRRLRQSQPDVFVLLTNSLSTAWIAWRSGARRRIGFARHHRGWLLTERLYAPRVRGRFTPRSAIDHYVELAEATSGRSVPDIRLELGTTAADDAAAELAISSLFQDPTQPLVVLNNGGAFGPAKAWPNDSFAELAGRLAAGFHANVLVICGPAERDAAQRIERLAGHPQVRSLAQELLSVGLSKACVRRAKLMVTTDSGPRHFAAAFDVPVVSLFGPTDPRWADDYHTQAEDLAVTVPCGPCGKRKCPLQHHRCMRDLSVDQVFRSASRLLGAERNTADEVGRSEYVNNGIAGSD